MMKAAGKLAGLFSPGNRAWAAQLLLLLPALALMGIVYLGGLLIFGRYSFDLYENGRLIRDWNLDSYRSLWVTLIIGP